MCQRMELPGRFSRPDRPTKGCLEYLCETSEMQLNIR